MDSNSSTGHWMDIFYISCKKTENYQTGQKYLYLKFHDLIIEVIQKI